MSKDYICRVTCDGCSATGPEVSGFRPDMVRAVAQARAAGWRRVSGNQAQGRRERHFCPACRAKADLAKADAAKMTTEK